MSNNKKVSAHLIEEAAKRGIVPGARMRFEDHPEWIVPSADRWHLFGTEDIAWCRDDGAPHDHCWIRWGRQWQTPIAPPATPPPLSDGDACECSETMRKAIVELAGELGVRVATIFAPGLGGMNDCRWDGGCIIRAHKDASLNWLPPEEFIARMRATAALPKPIRIGEWNVEFQQGSIKVGYTTVPNEVVRKVVGGVEGLTHSPLKTFLPQPLAQHPARANFAPQWQRRKKST